MRWTRWVAIIVAVAVLCGATRAARAEDYFGAIAYSPSTGYYGYSYGKDCQATAESVALQNCNGPDRQVVVWVANGYAALAVNILHAAKNEVFSGQLLSGLMCLSGVYPSLKGCQGCLG